MSDDNTAANAAAAKHEMMTTSPVAPLICKLAVPTIPASVLAFARQGLFLGVKTLRKDLSITV